MADRVIYKITEAFRTPLGTPKQKPLFRIIEFNHHGG